MDVRRNDPCPCGSGKRYKECHGALRPAQHAASLPNARSETEALKALARAQLAAGAQADAASHARRAVEIDPDDADAWNILGSSMESAEPEAARAAWEKAIALAPQQPEAHFRLGNFYRRRRDFDIAIAEYERTIVLGGTQGAVYNNLGLAFQQRGNLVPAEAAYREALRRDPRLAEAYANLGDLLCAQHRYAEAIQHLTKATAINAGVAKAWASLGVCQHRIGALPAARGSFERALALAPEDPAIMVNVASVMLAEQRYSEATSLLRRSVSRQPDFTEARNMLMYAKQQTCDWEGLERLVAEQREVLRHGDDRCAIPHNLIALPFTPEELLLAARHWVSSHMPAVRPERPTLREAVAATKLRIGYVSSDFRTHPLANLLSEVIERHDRSRFEVFGYSSGPDDGSAARNRFARAFDHFVDVRNETFEQTAERIRNDRIAILCDTSGYVIYARSEIFALRPAPIQVNCIGFPGTLGADYYDYILTDRFVTPPEQQKHFAEQFMYLPHCFMPGDTKRPVAASASRSDCDLPESAFVFCCFNASYKILPDIFDVWMRLLRDVPQSVLWLLETNPAATENLRREARRRDIAPDRLIFARRVPLDEHMARHALADLFLDTFPCNAHTTANDALFAGLPLLTCAGDTFASRVSGSHLFAIGLPELVTYDLVQYETVALRLAQDPETLAEYRERLVANRATHPLFDTPAYTRALEALLWTVWEQYLASCK